MLKVSCWVFAFGGLLAGHAHAEHCDVAPQQLDTLSSNARLLGQPSLTVGALGAEVHNTHANAAYQGVFMRAHWAHDFFSVYGTVTSYRLTYGEYEFSGIGDTTLGANIKLLRGQDNSHRLELVVGAMLPTGDAEKNLGMGHWMFTPGLASRHKLSARTELSTELSYAGALSDHAHHHPHGGPAPIVNPMNASEIGAHTELSQRLLEWLRMFGGLSAAVPVAVEAGLSRAIAMVGCGIRIEAVDFSVQGQLPFVGEPFTARLLAAASATF